MSGRSAVTSCSSSSREALTASRSETCTTSSTSAVRAFGSNTTQPVCGLTGPPTSTHESSPRAGGADNPIRSSIADKLASAGRLTMKPREPSGR